MKAKGLKAIGKLKKTFAKGTKARKIAGVVAATAVGGPLAGAAMAGAQAIKAKLAKKK